MQWLIAIIIILGIGFGARKMISDQIKKVYVDWRIKASFWSMIWGIPKSLTLAVIYKESAGFEKAKGRTGDYGLMQITQPALTDFNTNTGKNYKIEDMLTADKNIEVGAWYLYWLQKNYNLTWADTLRAYNVGIGTIQKSSTAGSDYASSVLAYQKSFEELMV